MSSELAKDRDEIAVNATQVEEENGRFTAPAERLQAVNASSL